MFWISNAYLNKETEHRFQTSISQYPDNIGYIWKIIKAVECGVRKAYVYFPVLFLAEPALFREL